MENLVITIIFIITIGSACLVAFSKNLIYSAFALIGTFLGVAAAFVYLSADFVGLTQVMVYAGGILVLTIFAVMLTARIESTTKTNPLLNYKVVAPFMLLLIILLSVVVMTDKWIVKDTAALIEQSTIVELGHSLLTTYLLPFELISILLLMSMIGAAMISRRQVKGEDA